jgi:hypothetical protein
VRLKGLDTLKKSSNLMGIRNRDVPACSIVPQPAMLSRAPVVVLGWEEGCSNVLEEIYFSRNFRLISLLYITRALIL